MNKFLTLVFLGLLLVLLRFSTQPGRPANPPTPPKPASYAELPATTLPSDNDMLDSYRSSRLLIATQSQQAVP